MLKAVTSILLFFSITNAVGQTKWTNKHLFEQKNFIENKGQFDDKKLPNNELVRFSAHIDGVEFCFTNSGYTIIKIERIKKNTQEKSGTGKDITTEEKEKKELQQQINELFYELKFIDINPNSMIIAENRVSNYYSYSDLKSEGKKGTIIANAFTKLTYRDIYPFTDIVFEFPKDSSGIKYSIYLHPGADVERVKMLLPENSKAKIIKHNLEINSPIGKIIDHKPISFSAKTKSFIKSKFTLSGNQIGFKIDNSNKSETIVIDPWTVTPVFASSNDAYDIDYDNAGNVYVHGGIFAGNPILLKYNPSGVLVWTYTATLFNSGYDYGDFAVDRSSNSIYVVQGFRSSGAQVVKMNSSALVMAVYSGHALFSEMWRISFSRCNQQAVIAGGGITSPTYQTCYLDTNLTSLSMVQYVPTLNAGHDVNMLALDNYGNCYQITNKAGISDGIFENQLVKLPLPTLMPTTYNVSTNYALFEGASNMFYGGSLFNANGYNGLTTSNTIVYSYDSYVLKKWDGPTGNLLVYKRISFPPGGDSMKVFWGGLSADDCGNLFLADNDTVHQYDATLTLINSYPMPGVITDVVLSNSGELYVCGLGFATTLTPTELINCTSGGTLGLTTTTTDATCISPGSATVTFSGGSPPYNIVWNTSPPQYGTTITGVPPGTYIVTITESSCFSETLTDTVTIGATGGAFFSTPFITEGCVGLVNNGAISVTPTGGVLPYTYSWSTGPGDTTNTVTGLSPGTYTLTITDSAGCTNTYPALVVDTASGVNISFGGAINCNSDTTTLSIILSGGSPPYGVNWTTPVSTGTTIFGVTAGNFTGTVTDASGCVQPFTHTLTEPPPFIASSTSSFNCAVPNSGIITVTASGGSNPPYTYSWTGFPLNTTNTNTNLPPGTYTVTVTDSNMCVITLVDTIENYSPLIINGTTVNACYGGSNGSLTAIPSGGIGGSYSYTWSVLPVVNTSTLSPVTSGTYSVTVTSGSCSALASFFVDMDPIVDTLKMITSYCKGETTANITIGGTTQGPYNWMTLPGINIPGATQNNFTGNVSMLNSYLVMWWLNGCKYLSTDIDSTVFPFLIATTPTNVFTPNNDANNDLFFPFVELTNAAGVNYYEEYHLQIFDRWGKKVFETTSSEKGWNGITDKSKKADAGVYFWIVNGKTNCHHKEFEEKGFVELVR